ncbi:hypothetical protein HU200_049995 [Digitaria exilis]|uniref:DUF7866 domain-containing protein n=1 Tax=Digitaria exilis TaxID=1010633 RepID=A0A835AS66_9POAL|nr:hypothetical protein HU200_049995 [Digitaria exilis]CAB3488910.1 unnamed protein product [Digitaria exilis]
MPNPPKPVIYLILLVLLLTSLKAEEEMAGGEQKHGSIRWRSSAPSSSETVEYVPVRRVVYRRWVWAADETPHRPFLVCSGRCRCCALSNSSNCVDTPCCFGINCNLPGKPYGTCAFQPVTCGCGSCPSQPPSSHHLLF